VGGASKVLGRPDRDEYEQGFRQAIVEPLLEYLVLLEPVEGDVYAEGRVLGHPERDQKRLVTLSKQISNETKRWAEAQ
jgi:hypothetical protein